MSRYDEIDAIAYENGKTGVTEFTVPVVLHSAVEGGYYVEVPDFGIGTQGNSIEECKQMAREAIGLWCVCRQEAGREIPRLNAVSPEIGEEDIVTFVDVDLDVFRSRN